MPPCATKGIQPVGQGMDEIARLRVWGVQQRLVAGVLVAITQVAGDGTGKTASLLLHTMVIAQIALGHLADIRAV